MSLTSELQNLLEHLKTNPHRPPVVSLDFPRYLVNDIRNHLVQIINNTTRGIHIDDILYFDGQIPYELINMYKGLIRAGLYNYESIRRLMFQYIDVAYIGVQNDEGLSESEKLFSKLGLEGFACLDEEENELLIYALRNHLCYYVDGSWNLTVLGRTFLRLPELHATRLLLSIETLSSVGMSDEWHIPTIFLKSFLEEGKVVQQSSTSSASIGWKDYIIRLYNFGLAEYSSVNPDTFILNSLGKLTIESLLAKDSIFDSLVPLYIREEIIGSEVPQYSTREDLKRIQELLDKSPLVGELKKPILDVVERLKQMDGAYLSIFKALAPCVEGILRNLTTKEGIEVHKLGMHEYVEAIRKAPKQILKPETLNLIDGLIKPYRNIVEHGHVIAPEFSRALCEWTLYSIEQIHKDYVDIN